jgi:hypothetical protein
MDVHIKTGDLVIGNTDPAKAVFSANGKKLTEGVFSVGSDSSIDEIKNSMIRNATNAGAKTTIVKKNKIRKQTKNIQVKPSSAPKAYREVFEDVQYNQQQKTAEPEYSLKSQSVIFENSFGRMRVNVENILEHDFAFLLVFSDSSGLIFEPKIGETLKFSTGMLSSEVYYPGVIFDWPDGVKKAMLLFKQTE